MENKRCHRNTLTRLLAILLVLCGVMTAAQAEGTFPEDAPEVPVIFGNPDGTPADYSDLPEEFQNVPDEWKVMIDENGVYQLTYTISEDTDDPYLKINLYRVLDALASMHGVSSSNVLQPGDVRVFRLWVQNKSGHTYRYMNGSFMLRTPIMDPENVPEEEADQVTAFDGQVLEKMYMGPKTTVLSYLVPAIKDFLLNEIAKHPGNQDIPNDIRYKRRLASYVYSDLYSTLRSKYGTTDTAEAFRRLMTDYYSEQDGCTYTDFDDMLLHSEQGYRDIVVTSRSEPAQTELVENSTRISVEIGAAATYNNMYQNALRIVYGEDDVQNAAGEGKLKQISEKTVYTVYDYYDDPDDPNDNPPTKYDPCVTVDQIDESSQAWLRRQFRIFGLPEDTLIYIEYPNYYFGFEHKNGEIATASNSQDTARRVLTTQVEYENVEWHRNGSDDIADATVANYMNQEGRIWNKANDYFNDMLGEGITRDESTWRSFMMAFNVDGYLAGNEYQDTWWTWLNTILLERVDGELEVQKVDARSQSTLTEPAEFRLWQYRTDKNGAQVKYLYDDAKDSFVPYDAQKGLDAYNLATVNGKISIEYALLEHEIYYLQEAEAPDGYKLKDTVFILADSRDALETAAKALKADKDVSDKAPMEYGGAIQVTEPLTIKVKNEPVPTPTPKRSTPTPVPPPNEFLMYFYKEWPDGQPQDIFFTLYTADGKVYKHTFKKIAVGENKFRYEAWLANDSEFFVIETEMKDYKVTYKNTGKYADITDRCYKGGTIVNSRVPTTGDSMSPAWMLLALASGCALLILKKRRAA